MENVSKALLIAGAVLVSILIISLGIYIYNKSTETTKVEAVSKLNQAMLMKFNEQYLVYEGRQTGTNVKQLLEYAVQNNQSLYKEEDTIKYCVCIRSKSKLILSKFTDGAMQSGLNGSRWYGVRYPDNIRKIKSAVSSSKIYMIEFKNNDLGYIWEIWINDAS